MVNAPIYRFFCWFRLDVSKEFYTLSPRLSSLHESRHYIYIFSRDLDVKVFVLRLRDSDFSDFDDLDFDIDVHAETPPNFLQCLRLRDR